MDNKRVIIVGGGAAGFFFAVNAAEIRPDIEFLILEQSPSVLSKVKNFRWEVGVMLPMHALSPGNCASFILAATRP